ncbi:hypothetical protein [uncultured Mediterranean phage uvMED]|jgi:hypothetical protein|nr:hypothetical protein [uncultured Mediterranean phage uvMED]|tara:strand:+ start:4788 stop:4958 length:171 start_codon:yes stop_codon:yes gene_type:complete
MSLEKNKKRAKAIEKNLAKEKREYRNTRMKQCLEVKMLKGHSLEQATKLCSGLIDS